MDIVNRLLGRAGLRLIPVQDVPNYGDLSESFRSLDAKVQSFTQTSLDRRIALWQAVHHVLDNGIAGDFVECGVWRGGSAMLMASALLSRGASDRKLYLYDTFAGMPKPTEEDLGADDQGAMAHWSKGNRGSYNMWNLATDQEVAANLKSVGFPESRLKLVKGLVEDTIPSILPERIALLRLDTDFYESTRHELKHMIPRLSRGGVVIIDDYGHFKGARRAVDEFLESLRPKPFLHRIDYTGRLFIKTWD